MARSINTSSHSNSIPFDSLYNRLRGFPSSPRPPAKPVDAALTDAIASLYVHPALEAGLHLLNRDLNSAHFLCRHMQAAPQHEGMYLHGILHRLEGDYDNARAWYADVRDTDVYRAVWGERPQDGLALIDAVQDWVARSAGNAVMGEEESVLAVRSRDEICGVIDFCVTKFGTEQVRDARPNWTQPDDDERKQLAQDMVTGDKGHRQF